MNILFIVSDTFRRDNLGCYGGDRVETPHLDRFAKKCVVFDNCYANSFPTMPARADIFTGRYTYGYLGWAPLPPDEITLAYLLTQAGYVTKAVVDTPFFLRYGYGYDRGFVDFEWIIGQVCRAGDYTILSDVSRYRRFETDCFAPKTVMAAERWLERHRKQKFFLYVDMWDPHEPWDPPSWYIEKYYPEYDGKPILGGCYCHLSEAKEKLGEDGLEEYLEKGKACYYGEVTLVDRWVGHLIETIEAMNLIDETAIIFTTDHGYYLGEHGYFGKAIQKVEKEGELPSLYRSPLYEEVAHIPLLIYVPGYKPRRTDSLVSLADLMPTVLALADVEIPDKVQAHSLKPILDGEDEGRDFVVTTWPIANVGKRTRAIDMVERVIKEPQPSTITSGEWSMLYSCQGESVELYHLPSDPKQKKNLFHDRRDIAENLLKKFSSHLRDIGVDPRLLKNRLSF